MIFSISTCGLTYASSVGNSKDIGKYIDCKKSDSSSDGTWMIGVRCSCSTVTPLYPAIQDWPRSKCVHMSVLRVGLWGQVVVVLAVLILYLKTIIIFSKLNPLSYKDGNVSSTQSYPDPTSALAPQTTLPWVSLVAKMASCRRTDPTTDKPSPTKTTFDLLESSWYHPTQIHIAPIRDSQVSNNIPLPPRSHLDPLASP